MSGYLQRLYDRAAGALPVAAPAFRPGSPLARFDQRLSIAELAQDFTFGARPDAAAMEREELVVPPPFELPADIPSPGIEKPPEQEGRKAAKPQNSKRVRREKTPPTSSSPTEPQAPTRRSERTGVTEAAEPPSSPQPRAPAQSKAVAGEPPTEAGTRTVHSEQPAQPSPAIAKQAPSLAPQPGQPRLNLSPITRHSDVRSNGQTMPEAAELTAPAAAVREPDQPMDPTPLRIPSQLPLPSAEPVPPDRPPAILPRPTAFDWSEIDQRIERALRGLDAGGPQRLERPPARLANESPQDAEPAPTKEFVTAAEASVIGSIENSSRHRMLFGTRWR